MASVAQVIIEVDDQAAGQAVSNLNNRIRSIDPSLQLVRRSSNDTMTHMVSDHTKAREAATLLAETINIQIPRSLRNVIAQVPAVASALVAAFQVVAVVAFANQVVKLVADIDGLKTAYAKAAETSLIMIGHLEEWLGLTDEQIRISGRLALETERFLKQRALFLPIVQQQRNLEQEAAAVTLQGLAAIEQKRKQQRDDILQLETQQLFAAKAAFGETQQMERARENIHGAAARAMTAADELAAAQRVAFLEKEKLAFVQAEGQKAAANLRGMDLIRSQTETALRTIAEHERQGAITHALAESQKAAATVDGAQKTDKFLRDIESSTLQYQLQAHSQGAAGTTAIELQLKGDLQRIHEQEFQDSILLPGRVNAAWEKADNARLDLARKNLEEMTRLQADAALAMLPPWQRAYAQIASDAEQQLRQVQEALRKTEISQEDAASRIAAIQTAEFAHMRDQLAGDLQSLFDDITSGNIGHRFLKEFEKMVFQMVATWMLSMKAMQGASSQTMGTGAGGILDTIFGGIFGGRSGGSVRTPPFVAPGMSIDSGSGLFNLPRRDISGIPDLSAVLPAGASTVGAGGSAAVGGAAGGALGGLLAKIFPYGLSIGRAKVSGAALGMLGATLGIDGFTRLLRGGSGPLGALETIGGATLTGFAIGGPLGAGIGAIVGGISALFGWLFGSGKKKRARQQLSDQLREQLSKIEDECNFYKLDYSGARDQVEQLRQQFADAEQKVGGSQRDWVDPWVDKTIREMNSTETERMRRAAISFGPAQFRLGGFVSPSLAASGAIPLLPDSLHFGSGGAVPAVLHAGEYVLRPEAVSQIGRPRLDRMNAGSSGDGDGGVHYHFAAGSVSMIDAKSFIEFQRRVKSEGWRALV
jgi:gas vesicle protein